MSTITASPISGLTDEQRDFQAAIRDFCRARVRDPEQRERLTNGYTELHNQEIYEKLAELGWLGVSIDEAYGGSGGGMVDACIFLEETMRGLVPIAGYGVSLIVAGAYERFGTEEQKQEILGGITPRAGSRRSRCPSPRPAPTSATSPARPSARTAATSSTARRPGSRAAHIADHILVIARSDNSGSKHEGLTMFSVPTDAEGIEIRGIETMGGKEVNDVFLTDCYVPDERVLGQVDGGWMQLMAGLNVERLILAASALGIAAARVRRRARLRQGAQAVRPPDRLVPGAQAPDRRPRDRARVHPPARLRRRPQGRRRSRRSCSRARRRWRSSRRPRSPSRRALEGMQMMGGYGYATEYDMERHVRATLVMSIYGGTNEIQREIVSKTYGL